MSKTTQFTIEFSHALSAAATSHLGTEVQVLPIAASGDDAPVQTPEALAIAVGFAGGLAGDLFIYPDEDASHAAFPLLDGASAADLSSAWLGLIQASVVGMADALRDQFGELRLGNCRVETMSGQLLPIGGLRFSAGDSAQGTISLLGDAALLGSLERSGTNSGSVGRGLSVTQHDTEAGTSFERVIDVPLGVTLRFGQRQLSLRELLDLNMGSLVELDRQVDEPVDLMLGERLIARGEVVIVDGNYGMRVTEVVEQPTYRGQDAR